jgi:hypothetical protein
VCLYILTKLNQQRMREWLQYKRSGPDSFGKFCFGFARGVESKISAIVRSATELAKTREAAALWYESGHKVTSHSLHFGKASSDAGLTAGGKASFHRGEVGRPQKLLK